MKTKVALAIVVVLAVLGGLAGVKALQIRKLMDSGKSFAPPPEAIASFQVREEKWQGILTAIGSVTAVQGVTVSPEIAGMVTELDFESGAVVSKGAILGQAWHPPGQPRPVYGRGQADRFVAVSRADRRRLFAAATGTVPAGHG